MQHETQVAMVALLILMALFLVSPSSPADTNGPPVETKKSLSDYIGVARVEIAETKPATADGHLDDATRLERFRRMDKTIKDMI